MARLIFQFNVFFFLNMHSQGYIFNVIKGHILSKKSNCGQYFHCARAKIKSSAKSQAKIGS